MQKHDISIIPGVDNLPSKRDCRHRGVFMSELKKYLAEFPETFVLILIGIGSAVVAGTYIGFLGTVIAALVWKYLLEDTSAAA